MAGKEKRNRKFDRNRKRSASMASYRASRRDESNRRKRIEKDKKAKEAAVLKNAAPDAVKRGTKRANLRAFYEANPSKRPKKEAVVGTRTLYNEDAPRMYAHFYGKKGRCTCCSKQRNDVVNEVCLSCSTPI